MQTTSSPTAYWDFVIVISVLLLLSISSSMAESSPPSESSSVYIVYTENPDGEAEPHHLQTLSTVLGSEAAAKEALLYTYTTAATGFSAKLTAAQAEEISKRPGVVQVVPSKTLKLYSGPKMPSMQNLGGV